MMMNSLSSFSWPARTIMRLPFLRTSTPSGDATSASPFRTITQTSPSP